MHILIFLSVNTLGSTYFYNRVGNAWSVQSKITRPDGIASEECGFSSAIYQSYGLITCWKDSIPAPAFRGTV